MKTQIAYIQDNGQVAVVTPNYRVDDVVAIDPITGRVINHSDGTPVILEPGRDMTEEERAVRLQFCIERSIPPINAVRDAMGEIISGDPRPYVLIEEAVFQALNQDRTFREAWVIQNGTVVVDVEKARELAHNMRRAKRDELLAPHDRLATSPIESVRTAAIAAKQAILDANTPVQTAIDSGITVAQFKQILVDYQAIVS